MIIHKNSECPGGLNLKAEFPWLDWLRFLAALCVVAGHARGHLFVDFASMDSGSRNIFVAPFFALTRLGTEAVTVFFVLSGYLVGGRAYERIRSGCFNLEDYAIDRLSRILVPLIPAVLFTWGIQFWQGSTDTPLTAIGNILALQGISVPVMTYNGPLWSLAYESWFYVLGGALAAIAAGRRHFCFFLLFIVCLWIFTLLQPHFLFCWILGVAAYMWSPRNFSLAIMLIGACLLIIGCFFLQFGMAGFNQKTWEFQPTIQLATVIFASGVATIVTQLVLLPPPKTGIAASTYHAGANLAAFSYSLYLVHNPVLAFLANDPQPHNVVNFATLGLYIVNVAFCLLVAYISYWLFESRTHRIRTALRTRAGFQGQTS